MVEHRRIALCHEWITTYGGSEQVAQRLARVLSSPLGPSWPASSSPNRGFTCLVGEPAAWAGSTGSGCCR
jgi:hypothetical protein